MTWLTACLFVPHLLVDVAQAQRPPSSRPLAVAAAWSDRAPILDRCERAARAGVQIGMPVLTARRLCRTLELATPDRAALAPVAAQVVTLLQEQGDHVRRIGTDRWTVRLVALGQDYRAALPLADALRAAVASVTGLRCRVGLAQATMMATIAARSAGDAAVQVVLPGTERAFLAPFPLDLLPGVGTQTLVLLARLGVETIGQLQALPASALAQVCGARGRQLAHLAQGLDGSTTSPRAATITVRWYTTGEAEADARRLRAHLHALTTQAGRDLRSRELAAGEVMVRVGWADGSQSQRTERDEARRDLDAGLGTWSRIALGTMLRERRLAVRALAVTLGDLGPRQGDLFAAADPRPWHLQQALDCLVRRYGPQTILPGALIGLLPGSS